MKRKQKISFSLMFAILFAFLNVGCSNGDSSDDSSEVKNINVVYAIASVPNIVATLEICKDNSPTLFYQSRDICDLQAMPKNVMATGSTSTAMVDTVKREIDFMRNLYPEAKFTLYLNDLWFGTLPLDFFEKQGIENYEVILITDGGGSYDATFSQFDTIAEYNAIDLSEYENSAQSSVDTAHTKYCMKLALEYPKYKWFLNF